MDKTQTRSDADSIKTFYLQAWLHPTKARNTGSRDTRVAAADTECDFVRGQRVGKIDRPFRVVAEKLLHEKGSKNITLNKVKTLSELWLIKNT